MKKELNQNNLIISLDDVISERFTRYAKYIIQERALPNLHDGMKPVQRRIIYALEQLKIVYNQPYKKAARIVGEVIGKYHPHGDSSVYEALVRMSQPWKLRYPLIDFQGNNGSIDGDRAAAMRYTEVRLTKLSSYLYNHLFQDTVLFVDNFDSAEREPVEFPAELPFLLLNGATGIAAGYATNIPSHNLNEIIDGTIALINNNGITLKKLMKNIPAPDFATGGIITNPHDIEDIYRTGSGTVEIESKIKIEGHDIVVIEIPYDVNKNRLLQQLDKIRTEQTGLMIKQIIDESDRFGLRIKIKLDKKAKTDIVKAFMFKHSNLKINFNCNMVSILDGHPEQVGLVKMLKAFLEFNTKITTSYLKWHLNNYAKRLEIVEGLIKAQDLIDQIIKNIRSSQNKTAAITNLINKLGFSELQADAIVNLRLYRLTATNIKTLIQESSELNTKVDNIIQILNNSDEFADYQIKQLKLIKQEFGDPRRSIIKQAETKIVIKETDLITKVGVTVFITKDGYINTQKYNNQLIQEVILKDNDELTAVINTTNYETIKMVTNYGQLLVLPLFKTPLLNKGKMGVHLNNFIKVNDSEKIIFATALNPSQIGDHMLLTTRLGLTKQIRISNELWLKSHRIIKIKDGDSLVYADTAFNPTYALYLNNEGFTTKYQINDIPILSSSTSGVKAMKLKTHQTILMGVYNKLGDNVVIINNKHKFKEFPSALIKTSRRPSTGVRTFLLAKSLITLNKGIVTNPFIQLYGINKSEQTVTAIDLPVKLSELSSKFSSFKSTSIDQILSVKDYEMDKLTSQVTPAVKRKSRLSASLANKQNLTKSEAVTNNLSDEHKNLSLNFDDLFNDD